MTLFLGVLAIIIATIIYGDIGFFVSTVCLILYTKIENLIERVSRLEKADKVIKTDIDKPVVMQSAQKYANDNEIKVATNVVETSDQSISKMPRKVELQFSSTELAIINWVKNNLLSGNPIAKIGIIILFVGVAFLLKYVSDHVHLTIHLRLIGVGVGGLIMLGLGEKLYARLPVYANILQGGGIGLIYLVTYSAFNIYHLIPVQAAFALLVATSLLAGLIAYYHDAKEIAVIGMLGGFLAPVLIGAGDISPGYLFSYYAILNGLIMLMSAVKSWPELNSLGFVATFIISAMWGADAYQPENYLVTQCFLVLFLVFYTAISILYAASQSRKNSEYIDAVVTFGTPLVVFVLQAGLSKYYPYGLAWSALALSCYYAAIVGVIYFWKESTLTALKHIFTAFSLIFATIALPLASSGYWVSFAWALEGLVVLYVGIKQQRIGLRLLALFLQVGACIMLISNESMRVVAASHLDQFNLTGMSIGVASIICANLWNQYADRCYRVENDIAKCLFVWGCFWWYAFGIHEIKTFISGELFYPYFAIFVSASSFAFWQLNQLFGWYWMRYPALALLIVMAGFAVTTGDMGFVMTSAFSYAWIVSFIMMYYMLYMHDQYPEKYLGPCHVVTFWLLIWFVMLEINHYLDVHTHLSHTYHYIVNGIIPAAALLMLEGNAKAGLWPMRHHENTYRTAASYLIWVYLAVWLCVGNTLSGDVLPWLYLPILNPLDMTILAVFGICLYGIQYQLKAQEIHVDMHAKNAFYIFVAMMVFFWLNAVLMRTIHHVLSIPYEFDFLWHSVVVQASLSVFWAVLALATTFIAARQKSREIWFCGAFLIGIVVVKLFMIDLSDIGALQRIISFISVGILLLINGYISPLPPKK